MSADVKKITPVNLRSTMLIKSGFVLLLTIAVAGCGDASTELPVVPARGKVTMQGLPLDGATLVFAPQDGELNVGSALAGPGGEFTIMTGTQEGAIPGRYKVIVTKSVSIPPKLDSSGHEEVPGQTKLLTPEKYSKLETTDLEVTIPPEGSELLEVAIK